MSSEFGQLNRNLSHERNLNTPFGSRSPQYTSKGFHFSKVSPYASVTRFNPNPTFNNPSENFVSAFNNPKHINEYNYQQNLLQQWQQSASQQKIKASEYILIRDVKEKNVKAILEFLKEFQIVSFNYEKDFGLIVRFSSEENAYRYLANGPKSIVDVYNNEPIILNCQFYFIEDEYENYGRYASSAQKSLLFKGGRRFVDRTYNNLNEAYVEKSLLEKFLDVFFNR